MFFTLGKPKNIDELKKISVKFVGIDRSKVKILIIDDETFEYLNLLIKHDFNIKQVNDIDDIKAVMAYDIVICDIKGVGKKFKSTYEGAHIISEIKKIYPDKYIIAYSGHSFNTSYNKYFQLADLMLKKDIELDSWIDNLDNAINNTINPIYQWKKIREFLIKQDVPIIYITKLEDEYVKSILSKNMMFPSNKILNKLSTGIQDILKSFAGSVLFKIITGI